MFLVPSGTLSLYTTTSTSSLRPDFVVLSLVVHPEQVCYSDVPPIESENLTNDLK